MTFLNPSFLWALLALGAPIVIHLFNFLRYKKVYFTNVRFLKELQIQSKSRSRLREWLVLLFRCLAILYLVLAFSQPVWRKNGLEGQIKGQKWLSIYIDNSFSMQNLDSRGPLLEGAKDRARLIVKSFGMQDKFMILTNKLESHEQRWYSREEALNKIEEVRTSSASRDIAQILNLQRDLINQKSPAAGRIYLISDAQKNTFNLSGLQSKDSLPIYIVPLTAGLIDNVYIDSCWFETPLQQKGIIQSLKARIVNAGKSGIESGSARLTLNEKPIALSSFSVGPFSSTEVKFAFECKESRWNYGSVKIEDYPISFDDEFFLAFNSRISIRVYQINGKRQTTSGALAALFQNDSLFRLTQSGEETINFANFRTSDVVILNQLSDLSSGLTAELQRFSESGGAMVIIPPAEPESAFSSELSNLGLPSLTLKDSSETRVEEINRNAPFYTGVFERKDENMNLPNIKWHFKFSRMNKSDGDALLSFVNKDAFLFQGRRKASFCYLFSAPLDPQFGNFIRHALFVPTIYRICFSALQQQELSYPVFSRAGIRFNSQKTDEESPPHLLKQDGTSDLIPVLRKTNSGTEIFTNELVQEPGFYLLKQSDKLLAELAFNYNRRESDLKSYSADEIRDYISRLGIKHIKVLDSGPQEFTEQVIHGDEAKGLWKIFIILALVWVAAEIAVLRILK
ncbi:MAG TPA: BatA and WFA domain-containing protein [Bacteroidia bacterium]|nr:BatA and WFA domain-containing protein [Bacteroidia bacterium]